MKHLLEIGTDKFDSEIPSPETGTVCDILAEPNDVIDVGNVIKRIDTSGGSHQPSDFIFLKILKIVKSLNIYKTTKAYIKK